MTALAKPLTYAPDKTRIKKGEVGGGEEEGGGGHHIFFFFLILLVFFEEIA